MTDVNGTDQAQDYLREKLGRLVVLKDYAVVNGVGIGDDLIRRVAELQSLSTEELRGQAAAVDLAIRDICEITYPITTDNISFPPGREVAGYERFKRELLFWGAVGVACAVGVAYGSFEGRWGDTIPQSCFALALGFLGAVVYSFFSALRVLPRTFGADDRYVNYARLVLGAVLGWVLYFTMLQDVFAAAFVVGNPPPANDDPERARTLLILPFLVGYSTTLAVGVLNKAITAVEITLGLEDGRVLMRERRHAKMERAADRQ